jgi:hypothetical protein
MVAVIVSVVVAPFAGTFIDGREWVLVRFGNEAVTAASTGAWMLKLSETVSVDALLRVHE